MLHPAVDALNQADHAMIQLYKTAATGPERERVCDFGVL